jgi:hypothetical protein
MVAELPAEATDPVTPTEVAPIDEVSAPTADPVLAAPDSSTSTGQVEPVAVAAPSPAQQVVYVQAPKPFVKKGNRGFGILIAVLSTIIFVALYAVALVAIELVNHQPVNVGFVTTEDFYAPAAIYLVGFIILALLVNRAPWPVHILGSIFVGLFVFFGATGLLLLLNVNSIPSNQVSQAFTLALFSPGVIVAALLAREVSLWMGFVIASRGRKVKVRNVDAKVLYDQEIAAKRAEYEQANAAANLPVVSQAPVAETGPIEPVVETETVPEEVAAP